MKKFLTAEWRDLIMANYEVDPSLLESRVPRGTELDLHQGKCFVSVVGFMFLNTRVLDFLVPFHVNFEEVNLRFYVRRETEDEVRRGVVFVKEIVPKAAIAAVARTLYGEPYERWSMSNRRDANLVSYSWQKGDTKNSIRVERGENRGVPAENSHGEFIIEHYWGYTKRGGNRTEEYKVEHPKWELYSAESPQIDVNFGKTYGDDFGFLNRATPYSTLLANGSKISVYKGKPIHHQLPTDH
jgi:uncharacterized protein YqjF (DUF2071 family)